MNADERANFICVHLRLKKTMRFLNASAAIAALAIVIAGCGSHQKKDNDFYTSGSKEADQRAEQRMAKTQQDRGESNKTDAKPGEDKGNTKKPLFDRLGGEQGITQLVDDFIPRALADPRVNWERKGVTTGGLIHLSKKKSVEWQPTADNVANLKKHIVQFLSVATGGPSKYEGQEMKEAHQGLKITNAEFDAAVGDLKASLDKLRIGTDEQKELLAIIESVRPQVVAER